MPRKIQPYDGTQILSRLYHGLEQSQKRATQLPYAEDSEVQMRILSVRPRDHENSQGVSGIRPGLVFTSCFDRGTAPRLWPGDLRVLQRANYSRQWGLPWRRVNVMTLQAQMTRWAMNSAFQTF
jgi:hypothetical protein